MSAESPWDEMTGTKEQEVVMDIDAIRKRAEEATPGPWRTCSASEGHCICGLIWAAPADAIVCTAHRASHDDGEGFTDEQAVKNAAFIANARSDIPALLAEIARQTADIARLAADLDRFRGLGALVERVREARLAFSNAPVWATRAHEGTVHRAESDLASLLLETLPEKP